MLFILTGQVQTGKTRWLETLVDDLEQAGIATYGVIAPGVWVDRRGEAASFPHADANGFEKTKIDNVLLPSHERIAFARRADLASSAGTFDSRNQSARAKLGWHISDESIDRVNAHFSALRALSEAPDAPSNGLLVIDELGRLELEHGGGITQAVEVLENGPTATIRHALVVVRESLLVHMNGRFAAWGEQVPTSPDERARQLVFDTMLDRR